MDKELITITEGNKGKSLRIVGEKKLKIRFDENSLTLEALYNKKWYEVKGNIYLSYIVVKG